MVGRGRVLRLRACHRTRTDRVRPRPLAVGPATRDGFARLSVGQHPLPGYEPSGRSGLTRPRLWRRPGDVP
ncbi:protein of unknown function [Modestobacter italicus]|uniref:Uncharacterized protein n=1 Tax=Modestobacter italicus (strain DSM 44449 / CECT 9708 / BC 501) TaxID=2732864 RepID=I4EQF6_MODI5|nr:protein of unknown function [Modestobacter marinus]